MNVKGEIIEKRGCIFMEWKIRDFFSAPPPVDEGWSSPSFYFLNASWCLDVLPNGEAHYPECIGHISIYLTRQESETETQKIHYILGVKASNGTEIKSLDFTFSFNKSENTYGWTLCELKELQLKKRKLFPDGVVTFFCKARGGENKNEVDAEIQTGNEGNCCRLSQNFKDLFLDEAGADVTIKVKGKEFRAHSQILSARSPVFAAMFRHDTKERNTGVVEIPEYDPDSFRQFLMFLYSGQAEKLSSENVAVLYSAADKYNMEELKTCCYEFMKKNISVDSICNFLSLAVTYEDKDLIDVLTNFFVENVKKILVTVEWMSFAKQYPVQSNELFIRTAQRFVPDETKAMNT